MDEKYTYDQNAGFTFLEHIPDENVNWTHVQDHDFGGRYDTQLRAPLLKRQNDDNEKWQKAQMIPEKNVVPIYTSHPSNHFHTDSAGRLGEAWKTHDYGPWQPIRSQWAVDKNNPNLDVNNQTNVHRMGMLDIQDKETPQTARAQLLSSFDHEVPVMPWTDGIHTFTNIGMSKSTAVVYGNKENKARMPGGGPLVTRVRHRDEIDAAYRDDSHKETVMAYRPLPSMPQSNEMHHMVGESDMAIMNTKAYLEYEPNLPKTTTYQFDTYHTGQMNDTDLKVIEPDGWY